MRRAAVWNMHDGQRTLRHAKLVLYKGLCRAGLRPRCASALLEEHEPPGVVERELA